MDIRESVIAADAGTVLDSIRRLVRFLRLAHTDAEATTGLSASQLYVLHDLHDHSAASLDELAERLLTDPAAVASVVDRLVRRGMIKRARTREDPQRVELRLTAIGLRVVRNAPHAPQAVIVQGVRRLPAAHRAELTRALETLVTTIGAHAMPARMLFEDEPVTTRRSRTSGRHARPRSEQSPP